VIDRHPKRILLFFAVSFLLLAVLWLARPRSPRTAALPPAVTASLPAPTFTRRAVQPTSLPEAALERAPTLTPGLAPETATPSAPPAPLEGFYAAPHGSQDGDGSRARPWDLNTAFNHPDAVQPGDTLWLLGGTYVNPAGPRYTSRLVGEEGRPIIVRQYPGERATIDGGILAEGAWTWFWGFEITNSSGGRASNGAQRPPGLYMVGRGQKAINLIVHDTGHPGIGFWSEVGDGGEVYGCIIWGVGTYDTDRDARARGSAIYAQNENGTHLIRDVISFRNLTTGMKAYAEQGHVNGFTFEGNISFDNADRLLFVSGRDFPVQGLVMRNNYTYRSPYDPDPPVRLGYADVDQGDAVVQGNVFVNGMHEDGAFWVKRFSRLVFTDNLLVSPNVLATFIPAGRAGETIWDRNHYFGGGSAPFRIAGRFYPFEQWQAVAGFDGRSTYSPHWPTGSQVFVRPNLYEPGRAHVAVYNWEMNSSVAVDLTGVLSPGDAFRVIDVQNYFGDPVVEGVYDGRPVAFPMNLVNVASLQGSLDGVQNTHTSPEFGAFVVEKIEP